MHQLLSLANVEAKPFNPDLLSSLSQRLSQDFGTYKLIYMYSGIFICLIAIYILLSKVKNYRNILIMSLFYSTTLFSSSFVEEEHNIWYYLYPTLLVTTDGISFEKCWKLALFRAIIYWNTVGDKHINRPDMKLFLNDRPLITVLI